MTWELNEQELQEVENKESSLLVRACLWGACSALVAFGFEQLGGDGALLACLVALAAAAGVLELRRRPRHRRSVRRAGLFAALVFVASLVALVGLVVLIVSAFGL